MPLAILSVAKLLNRKNRNNATFSDMK